MGLVIIKGDGLGDILESNEWLIRNDLDKFMKMHKKRNKNYENRGYIVYGRS